MTEASTFKEAIDNKRFLEAEDMIYRGDDILKSQWQFNLYDAFPKIIQNKAYHIIFALIEQGHIETDIYEYDSFKNSLFECIVMHIDDSEESIAFIDKLLPLLENINDNLQDDTWLQLAFMYGAPPKIVETMLNGACNINYINNADENIAHILISRFYHKLTIERKLELLQLAVNNGIDVNQKNKLGNTPLHIAIANKEAKAVNLLLENGADANLPNNVGKTAYYLSIVEQLDVDTTLKMAEYCPPDFYVEIGKQSTLLYDYIQACYAPSITDNEKQMLQFFAENGADINQASVNAYGEIESVSDVIAAKNFDYFDAFLDVFPIDINHADNHGNTLLHKVCAVNVNFDQGKAKDVYRKAKKLIHLGADVSLTNTDDKTAMNLASDDNLKEKTVALLLQH